ncbi:hypothetical protein [Hymenobacter lucidus]|uniref:Secreted protein n=1 Tax=Hymenobacter lucidus TaxID=2880930 RepID=A0ABS8AWM8_9BACT|nr:hypothetical protein [Hymenobacter lucidus]MCB2410215.1 hypothetical protein [Hymenobacter lucidus]
MKKYSTTIRSYVAGNFKRLSFGMLPLALLMVTSFPNQLRASSAVSEENKPSTAQAQKKQNKTKVVSGTCHWYTNGSSLMVTCDPEFHTDFIADGGWSPYHGELPDTGTTGGTSAGGMAFFPLPTPPCTTCPCPPNTPGCLDTPIFDE